MGVRHQLLPRPQQPYSRNPGEETPTHPSAAAAYPTILKARSCNLLLHNIEHHPDMGVFFFFFLMEDTLLRARFCLYTHACGFAERFSAKCSAPSVPCLGVSFFFLLFVVFCNTEM
jgi:hypothetical protein